MSRKRGFVRSHCANHFTAKEAKMAIPFSSLRGQRFSWEEVCTAAALETDHARIEEPE